MENLANSREIAENKLIVLYFINKVNMPVSNLQLIKVILENRLMNYFFLQQSLVELNENGSLSCDLVEEKSFYEITQNGKQALSLLLHMLPAGIRFRIDKTVTAAKSKIKNETLITADFVPESESKFYVECKVNEDNFTLLEIKAAVGTRQDALGICANWKKHSPEIYAEIIESLTRKRI
jgi:hypothetical protein